MTDTPIEKLTRVYIKMRDAKAKLAAEFKEKEYSLNAQMDQVKAALLDYCKEHEVESVRTASGLVYRSKKNAVLDQRLGSHAPVCCREQRAGVS